MASTDAKDCDPSELAATQAREILVEVTADANTEPTYYWCPDTPADEKTLSIDHIREQLFSLLTPEDLFNCRRLNRIWNSYTTVELQERFVLKCTIKEDTLEEYLYLLQKHQEIFPCLPFPIFRKYYFEMGKGTWKILSNPLLQQFLRTYGYFIRDLSLNQNGSCHSYDMPNEKDVMNYVRSLLIHSAPNLASLSMCGIDLKVGWKEPDLNRYQDSRRPLRTTDPEFEEIHSIPGTDKNKNLKFFSFKPIISGKIFELAVQLAPNLEEIQVQGRYGSDHKYFIEPLNRLGLCKDMKYSTDSTGLFNKFADLAQEGNLKLRNFSFMFGKEDCVVGLVGYLGFMQSRFWETNDDEDVDANAINKLLACSWDSLETVEWRWVMEVPGLKWPEVMPNVWRINLGPHHHTLYNGLLAFPPEFIWSKAFPKLRHLHICEKINSLVFPELIQCFKNQCVDSVEEVHVFEKNSEERDAITLENLMYLRRLFPSAQVLSTWPYRL